MDRSAALAYLTGEFSNFAADAKFTAEQLNDEYNVVIDNALRLLGVEEADLATAVVAQADIIKYMALLDYFALRRFSRVLALRVDTELSGGFSLNRSQAARQIKPLLDDAAERCANLGIDLGTQEVMQIVRYNIDIYEPSACSGGEFA